MPASAEHRAIVQEAESAMQQAQQAPLQRDKSFSWQQLQVSQALSRMYVAGMRAAQTGLTGAYHDWHIKNAQETHD
ncbi:hypothetical protein LJ737_20840 [Hymenobacter sp. 15J16-1T3B]|uniref:hypothetical protein n=1 Tax=Hymenobacter sp. 15J16-1T3B TaxID=2886941 RepID=UPI001D12169B|nr:hypothetical protein [Hymenobacter sp. 15J16-1T3B]MCC3159701.1 hypothetical protein [Hymenobacter sp. 15J16-1T3B]